MEVRRAVVADAAALADVARDTFPLACPPGTTDAAIAEFIAEHLTEQRFHEYLVDPARELYLALDGPAVVGYTMLVFGDPTDPDVASAITTRPTAELSKCYALAEYHGTGVSMALLRASIEGARSRGSTAVWLGVNEFNDRANRFYEKSGFAVVGMKRFLVGDQWHDDFVRELVL